MNDRMEINKLNQMAFILERYPHTHPHTHPYTYPYTHPLIPHPYRDMTELAACKDIMHRYNPLLPYAYLSVGIFSTLISLLWILQIILSVLTDPSVSPFLSVYFLWFDSW